MRGQCARPSKVGAALAAARPKVAVGAALAAARWRANFQRGNSRSPEPPGPLPCRTRERTFSRNLRF